MQQSTGTPPRKSNANRHPASPASKPLKTPHPASSMMNMSVPQRRKFWEVVSTPCVVMPMYGPLELPDISVTPWRLVANIVDALVQRGTQLSSVRLEGSAATHVVNPNTTASYNDLDFVFYLGNSAGRDDLEHARDCIVQVLSNCLPTDQPEPRPRPAFEAHPSMSSSESVPEASDETKIVSTAENQAPPTSCPTNTNPPCSKRVHNAWPPLASTVADGYLRKIWITPPREDSGQDDHEGNKQTRVLVPIDAWAVATVGCTLDGKPSSIDFKFVKLISRPFQFSADSLQIVMSLAELSKPDGSLAISPLEPAEPAQETPSSFSYAQMANKNSSPQYGEADWLPCARLCSSFVTQEGKCGLNDTLAHLEAREIVVADESDMAHTRGGGLLKYISLLSKEFVVGKKSGLSVERLEKYMMTRFLIDYPGDMDSPYGLPMPVQVVWDYVTTRMLPSSETDTTYITKQQDFLELLAEYLRRHKGQINRMTELAHGVRYIQLCVDEWSKESTFSNIRGCPPMPGQSAAGTYNAEAGQHGINGSDRGEPNSSYPSRADSVDSLDEGHVSSNETDDAFAGDIERLLLHLESDPEDDEHSDISADISADDNEGGDFVFAPWSNHQWVQHVAAPHVVFGGGPAVASDDYSDCRNPHADGHPDAYQPLHRKPARKPATPDNAPAAATQTTPPTPPNAATPQPTPKPGAATARTAPIECVHRRAVAQAPDPKSNSWANIASRPTGGNPWAATANAAMPQSPANFLTGHSQSGDRASRGAADLHASTSAPTPAQAFAQSEAADFPDLCARTTRKAAPVCVCTACGALGHKSRACPILGGKSPSQ